MTKTTSKIEQFDDVCQFAVAYRDRGVTEGLVGGTRPVTDKWMASEADGPDGDKVAVIWPYRGGRGYTVAELTTDPHTIEAVKRTARLRRGEPTGLIQTANGYLLCSHHAEVWQRGGNTVSMWPANRFEAADGACADCVDEVKAGHDHGPGCDGPLNCTCSDPRGRRSSRDRPVPARHGRLLGRPHRQQRVCDMVTGTLDFIVSAGHDEYPLNLRSFSLTDVDKVDPAEMVEVWPGSFDVYEWDDDPANEGVDLSSKWGEVTHLPETAMPDDVDLMWETIYHVHAERPRVEMALEHLMADISNEPGGDDDTFDYWPSGVRLALAVADHLGPEWVKRVEDTARRVITTHKADFADELFDKTGVQR